MRGILKKLGVVVLLLSTACELDNDLVNPNEISVNGADIDLIMNSVQLDFADFFNSASNATSPLVRMTAMTGGFRYQTANQPEGMNLLWGQAYRNVLINSQTLIELAEPKKLTTHVAVAKILQAYTYLTLVDIFGDVPQSEALAGASGNFNPIADPGESVYAHAISLLQAARTELAKTGADAGAPLNRDIYYGGNRTKWTALANSIELKAWLNLSMLPNRLAEANNRIDALLALDLVDTEAENFTYKYGTATVPVSRHPLYRQYYDPLVGNAAGYIANYFMFEMYRGKPDPTNPTDATLFTQDPRWRYYFYRQVGSYAKAIDTDPKSVGCAPAAPPDHYASVGAVFCLFDPGFYGRDHGDASGTNPDSPFITAAGVYPAGGKIDNTSTANANYHAPTIQGDGANGAGIQPIYMSFFTDYMKAEILARRGDFANAKTALATAITNSVTQVRNFATSKGQTTTREPSLTTYQSAVSYLYDESDEKLDVIGKEFYLACWGNGVEAYNNYRRTSAPLNIQPVLQLNPGPFFRSQVYPADYVNLNSNAVQKDVNSSNKVFWDTNPATLN